MKRLALGLFLGTSVPALATSAQGFVTPTSMGVPVTSVTLVKVNESGSGSVTLYSGSTTVEFTRAGSDFAAIPVSDVTVPAGRYSGASVCYLTQRTIKLDGVSYQGGTVGGYSTGTAIYTASGATDGTTAGSVTTTATATPSTVTLTGIGSGSQNCSTSYYAKPICLPDNSGAGCESGDTVLSTSSPTVYLLMDLYHSVGIDPSNNSLDNHVPAYPYPSLGKPGAAVHLSSGTGTNIANITLIFNSDGSLAYSGGYQTGSTSGFCSGVGAVTATAAPSGSVLNSYGPTWVMDVSSGQARYAAGTCSSGTSCTSNGINVISNFKQAVSSTTNVQCLADSAVTPANLGFTYTAGSGNAGTATFTIQRVIDPSNILGSICTTNGGVCGTYP